MAISRKIRATFMYKTIYLILNKYKNNRILINSSWSVVGEVISKALIFITFVLTARILGRDEYGQFGILRTTILMVATFGGMGLGLTANRYISQEKNRNKNFSGKIIGISHIISITAGFLFGCLVFLFAESIAYKLNAPFLITELKISAGILFLCSINGAQIGILQGLESFKKLAICNLIQSLLFTGLLTIGSYYWSVKGTIGGYLISVFLYTIILEVTIYSELKKYRIKVIYSHLNDLSKIIWHFTIPAALTGIVVAPFKWYSETLIVKNGGFNELGIFQAAIVITTIIITISSALNAPLISLLSGKQNEESNEKLQYFSIYGSWYFFLLLSLPFILFPNLITLIFGEKFNDPSTFKTNLFLLLYCGLLLYYQGITRTLIVKGYLWFSVSTNIIEGMALVIYLFLSNNFTSYGLSKAYVFSYIVRTIITIPILFYYKIISTKILLNKYFILSLLTFIIIILFMLNFPWLL